MQQLFYFTLPIPLCQPKSFFPSGLQVLVSDILLTQLTSLTSKSLLLGVYRVQIQQILFNHTLNVYGPLIFTNSSPLTPTSIVSNHECGKGQLILYLIPLPIRGTHCQCMRSIWRLQPPRLYTKTSYPLLRTGSW